MGAIIYLSRVSTVSRKGKERKGKRREGVRNYSININIIIISSSESGLTRDGTAEPASRYQILRRERGQGKYCFPNSADHEQDWNRTRSIHTLLKALAVHFLLIKLRCISSKKNRGLLILLYCIGSNSTVL